MEIVEFFKSVGFMGVFIAAGMGLMLAKKGLGCLGWPLILLSLFGMSFISSSCGGDAIKPTDEPVKQTINKPVENRRTSQNQPSKNETATNGSAKEKKQNRNEKVSLGQLTLGDNKAAMINVHGNPRKTEVKDGDKIDCFYNDLEVHFSENAITMIVAERSNIKTNRGIHPGSSLKSIIEKYGDNYERTEYGEFIMYEYYFDTKGGTKGILRFAVRKADKKVEYISMRRNDL